MIFTDTNYFLRFLLKDIDRQHEEARELFDRGARGEIHLFTSLIVFFEVYWTLSSFYGKKKIELADLLRNILEMSFIEFQEYELLTEAVEFFSDLNYDLEDAFNLVYAKKEGAGGVKTFDRKLLRKFNKFVLVGD